MPFPGTASNLSGSGKFKFFSSARCTIASPRGCSDLFSTPAANNKISFSVNLCFDLLTTNRSVKTGLPLVIVPVLSRTTVVIEPARSSDSPDLYKIPFCAPLPDPTITAVGVAKPIAQGQAINNTATAFSIALAN